MSPNEMQAIVTSMRRTFPSEILNSSNASMLRGLLSAVLTRPCWSGGHDCPVTTLYSVVVRIHASQAVEQDTTSWFSFVDAQGRQITHCGAGRSRMGYLFDALVFFCSRFPISPWNCREANLEMAKDEAMPQPRYGTPTTEPAASPEDRRWYLIHCKPREDQRALEHLTRQGFECFWPARFVERRREGRKYLQREALFTRYLFIRLDSVNDNWSSIRSTRGVQTIVNFANRPAPVPEEIISAIRARLTGAETVAYLKAGDRVRISEGAFSQLEALFVTNDGDERVVLLLNILQKDQELSFPLNSVRKVG